MIVVELPVLDIEPERPRDLETCDTGQTLGGFPTIVSNREASVIFFLSEVKEVLCVRVPGPPHI